MLRAQKSMINHTKPDYVLCLSGGMDSTVLLYDLVGQFHKVHCVLFEYGQKHVQELTFAQSHCHRLGCLWTTIELPKLRGSTLTDGKGGVVVPFRNAILLSHAVNLAVDLGAKFVAYGCNKADAEGFPDCRQRFIDAMNATLKASEIDVQIQTPYLDFAKWRIAELARIMGVDLSQTWSCYKGGLEPCGECPACLKRKEALEHDADAVN